MLVLIYILRKYVIGMIWLITLIVISVIFLWIRYRQTPSTIMVEGFNNQMRTSIPQLSLKFQSPKSDLQNFNETTILHQNLNQLQSHNSNLIDRHQPFPLWVYPFTYINRHFDQIITTLVHQMEKDFNQGLRLSQRPNQEWR